MNSRGGFDFHDGEWEELVASCREQNARQSWIAGTAADKFANHEYLEDEELDALIAELQAERLDRAAVAAEANQTAMPF